MSTIYIKQIILVPSTQFTFELTPYVMHNPHGCNLGHYITLTFHTQLFKGKNPLNNQQRSFV
jgi:hypothetical protein